MRTNSRLLLAAVVFALTIAPLANAQKAAKKGGSGGGAGGPEEQIKALEDQTRESALKGDTSFMEKYLTDDYLGVGGNGQSSTKQQAVQMRKSGEIKYQTIEVRDQKVRVYGNTAIVNLQATVKATFKGEDISGDYRASRVWVKQNGGWKIANFQSTRMAPAGK
jgi:uncharacterized protein (TIGR02246 family)